jgi:hypothetical protein
VDSGSIIVAIIVGIIGLFFAVLKPLAARRVQANAANRLIFVIGKTKSLDQEFGQGPGMRIFGPDNTEVTHINQCNIGCTNVATDTIKDLKFEITLPGSRKYLTADFKTTARDIATSASYTYPFAGGRLALILMLGIAVRRVAR